MSSCAKHCDNVMLKASQIFSSDANDGVIDFFIPRGDGRLWQARAFSKLIFRPSPRLTILLDDFQNICHNFTTLDFSFIIL